MLRFAMESTHQRNVFNFKSYAKMEITELQKEDENA